MNSEEKAIPFGLLFEEAARQYQEMIVPFYDEGNDIAYVVDSQGRHVPYVEYYGAMGTETLTEAKRETADTDWNPDETQRRLAGTDTFTEVAKEPTDKD